MKKNLGKFVSGARSEMRMKTSRISLTRLSAEGGSAFGGKIKTKSIKQVVLLNAPPAEVYDMLMDSKKHGAFTGSPARISRKIDGTFTAYDGWIKGKNLKLTPNRLIIQEWRGDDWPKGYYSKAMFLLSKHPRGTKLTFGQTGIPVEFYADIKGGWKTEYWDKMKKMIAEQKKKAA